MEKYATLIGAGDARKKMIAFQSALGDVSGVIQRYMIANPDGTWAQLKTQLAARFSDVTDTQFGPFPT